MRIALACLSPCIAMSGLIAVEENGSRTDHVHVEIQGHLQEWWSGHLRPGEHPGYAVVVEGKDGKRCYVLDLPDHAVAESAKALNGKAVVVTARDFRAAEVGDGKRRETTWIQVFVTVGKITPVIPAPP